MAKTIEGWDQAVPVTEPQLSVFKGKGLKFVGRYINGTWKLLGNPEARRILDAGFDIMPIYQTTAEMSMGGKVAGIEHGNKALQCASSLSIPAGTTIFFAVDFDVTKATQYVAIKEFFTALKASAGIKYQIGIYAEYDVIEWAIKNKVANDFWQTYAWSGGKVSTQFDVFQYSNSRVLYGYEVDLCRAREDFGGFWTARKVSVPLPSPTPNPVVLPEVKESIPLWEEQGRGWIVKELDLDPKFWDLANKPITIGRLGAILQKWDAQLRGIIDGNKK